MSDVAFIVVKGVFDPLPFKNIFGYVIQKLKVTPSPRKGN